MANWLNSTVTKDPSTPGADALPEGSFSFNVLVAVINVLLSLTATLGNAMILTALPKVTSMHGPSKVLLGSLALSDLCVGAVLHPLVAIVVVSGLTDSAQTQLYAWALLRPVGNYLYAVSLLTITFISADRFLAVYLQFRYRNAVTLRRVSVALLAVWSTPALVLGALRPTTVDELEYHILNAVYISVGVSVPSVLYIMSYKLLSRHQNRIQSQQNRVGGHAFVFDTAKYKKSVNNMLFVYFALLSCYLPTLFLTIASLTNNTSKSLLTASQFTFVLVLLNSTLNPVLYCWRIRGVRKASLDLLKKVCFFCPRTNEPIP